MKEWKPISVYAINATVYKDVTPAGKEKYIIKLNNVAGDGIDRVQNCHDYDQRLDVSFRLVKDARVYKNGHDYITFAMYPKDNDSNYLLTCRCNHPELSQAEALGLIKKGMSQAIAALNS